MLWGLVGFKVQDAAVDVLRAARHHFSCASKSGAAVALTTARAAAINHRARAPAYSVTYSSLLLMLVMYYWYILSSLIAGPRHASVAKLGWDRG